MVTPQLQSYVSQMRLNKKSDDEIKAALEKSGWSQPDIISVLSPQPAPAAAPLPYQGIGIRFGAQVVDLLITFLVFGYGVALLSGQTTSKGFQLTGVPAIVEIVLMFAYFILLEGFFGATLGKMVFKLKVVKENGTKVDMMSAVVRNLMRIVDALPFLYIVGIIAISRSQTKQRVGDKVAHTVVVKQ